ncbi:activator of HSP90 ATPase [Chryseobacterium sp. SNU WT5]|uniref:SRPBCC domain-containing protein n=1 Tax=Chryseobacterium sp. SNU WT5 TaxID=2594269 RepID=UPI00118097DA|nr:SRPBCC domain-containing protein [Chryseobacterium sp. SNU WT5]QDP84287.1 activator of HSP90 ATPase [Chryseobacterium sp. SNU WT5]
MEPITINITILKPIQKVWDYFYNAKHIVKWNFTTTNWHCPKAVIDFQEGGKFDYRLEYKDKSFGYNIAGTIEEIKELEYVKSQLDDGRKIEVHFRKIDENTTEVIEIFEPEIQFSREMQRVGWYAILDRFHKYVEKN